LGGEVLNALAHAVAATEEVQQRFRAVVLGRLSRIEAMLSDVQGAQLVEFWPPEKVTDEQRAKYLREVEERITKSSYEMGLKLVKYVYGGQEALDPQPKVRCKRSDNLSYEI
jgi:hypothetical protein